MRNGTVLVNLTGHRKATSRYCPTCAVWHDTPRGLLPYTCVAFDGTSRSGQAPAVIPADHLGTRRKRRVQIPLTQALAGRRE